MTFRIRRAFPDWNQVTGAPLNDDARILKRLDDALLPGCPETPAKATACVWWLMYGPDDDGDPEAVGYCAMRVLEPGEPGAGAGYLARYGVVGGCGGRGLGKRLLRVASRHAKAIGCPEMQTYTISNPGSANALIAVGYRQFEAPWCVPTDETVDVSYWRLRLR